MVAEQLIARPLRHRDIGNIRKYANVSRVSSLPRQITAGDTVEITVRGVNLQSWARNACLSPAGGVHENRNHRQILGGCELRDRAAGTVSMLPNCATSRICVPPSTASSSPEQWSEIVTPDDQGSTLLRPYHKYTR